MTLQTVENRRNTPALSLHCRQTKRARAAVRLTPNLPLRPQPPTILMIQSLATRCCRFLAALLQANDSDTTAERATRKHKRDSLCHSSGWMERRRGLHSDGLSVRGNVLRSRRTALREIAECLRLRRAVRLFFLAAYCNNGPTFLRWRKRSAINKARIADTTKAREYPRGSAGIPASFCVLAEARYDVVEWCVYE
jgi:hypothetical protein